MLDDLAEIEAIELEANPVPWTKQALSTSFNVPNQIYVLTVNNQIKAYLIGLESGGEASLLHIVVQNTSQRLGLATQLLTFWLEHLRRLGFVEECWLEVRRSNLIAQRCYEKLGFKQVAVRQGYYARIEESHETPITVIKKCTPNREDALIYRFAIN